MKEFLKKAFPFLATAATAGLGPIGAVGASVLGAVLGKDVKPDQLEAELGKLYMSEEGRLKAQEAEQKFELEMRKLHIESVEEMERIAMADRDSARKREMAVKDKMPMILGIGALTAFTASLSILIFYDLPMNARDTVIFLLGILSKMISDVYGYYFGSSAGSAEKSKLLAAGNGNGSAGNTK